MSKQSKKRAEGPRSNATRQIGHIPLSVDRLLVKRRVPESESEGRRRLLYDSLCKYRPPYDYYLPLLASSSIDSERYRT